MQILPPGRGGGAAGGLGGATRNPHETRPDLALTQKRAQEARVVQALEGKCVQFLTPRILCACLVTDLWASQLVFLGVKMQNTPPPPLRR